MRILITGSGGPSGISVWKSLNAEHELYMADIDPCAAGLYLVPPAQRLLLPKGNAADFVPTVLAKCKEHRLDMVISTVDEELFPLAAATPSFSALGVKLPLCSAAVLQTCRDKYALLNQSQNVVPIPHTTLLTADLDYSQFKHFPLFAKPRFGAGSNGTVLIKKVQDLQALPCNDSYLIQEFLPGEEYSVDVYLHSSGRPIAAVPRLRMKIDSGIAVAARTMQHAELAALALKIAASLQIRYVANVQFRCDLNGQFKLLEINPRFPGTLPLTVAAGVDIPKLLVSDMLGQAFPENLLPFEEIMVVRYLAENFISLNEWKNLCRSSMSG